MIHVAKCSCHVSANTRIFLIDFSISLSCEASADDEKVRHDRQQDIEIAAALMRASWFKSVSMYSS